MSQGESSGYTFCGVKTKPKDAAHLGMEVLLTYDHTVTTLDRLPRLATAQKTMQNATWTPNRLGFTRSAHGAHMLQSREYHFAFDT